MHMCFCVPRCMEGQNNLGIVLPMLVLGLFLAIIGMHTCTDASSTNVCGEDGEWQTARVSDRTYQFVQDNMNKRQVNIVTVRHEWSIFCLCRKKKLF